MFCSPDKNIPKKTSPLKKMGSLRKESHMMVADEQENNKSSPIKVYGASRQASKMLAKASSMEVTDSLRCGPTAGIKKQASESP